jgi:hypothetical protein
MTIEEKEINIITESKEQFRDEIYEVLKYHDSKERLDKRIISDIEMHFSIYRERLSTLMTIKEKIQYLREQFINCLYTRDEFIKELVEGSMGRQTQEVIINKHLVKRIKELEYFLEVEQEQFQFYQDKATEYQKKRENKIKELERELYLETKPLPNLPQIKKESKFKLFKKKLTNKVNKIFRWKEQKQEVQYIAQIEVKETKK